MNPADPARDAISARVRAIMDAADDAANARLAGRTSRGEASRREATAPPADAGVHDRAGSSPAPAPADLAVLVAALTQQTRKVRGQVDALTAALDRVEARLDHRPGPATPSPGSRDRGSAAPAGRQPRPAPPRSGASSTAREPRGAGAQAVGDTARLVAVEMAVGGATRGQVGGRLRDKFGMTDVDRVLDSVFGADTADDTRVPWS